MTAKTDTKKLRGVGPVAQLSAETRRNATLFVAASATDVDDCAELLAMLGLTPQEGRP